MSRLRLTSPEMVHTSTPWVTPGDPAHQLIISKPALLGVLPALTQAYRGLQALLTDERSERQAALSQRAAKLKRVHDNLVHVIFGGLSALIRLEPDREQLEEIAQRLVEDEMDAVAEQALGAAERAGSTAMRADALAYLAMKHLAREELKESETLFAESLRIARAAVHAASAGSSATRPAVLRRDRPIPSYRPSTGAVAPETGSYRTLPAHLCP